MMGGTKSKIEDSPANVVNEVEIDKDSRINLFYIELMLTIIMVVVVLKLLLRIYSHHKGSLKKRYLARALSTEQI